MTDTAPAPKPRHSDADVAEHAEREQAQDKPDPFPPEGTDDKTVRGPNSDQPISDSEAVRATKAVIDVGLSGQGQTPAEWTNGRPDKALSDGTESARSE